MDGHAALYFLAITAALDAARTELESLRRSQARSSEEQEFRLRAEAQMSMENLHAEAEERERALNRMIAELRTHLAQVNEAAGWREVSIALNKPVFLSFENGGEFSF